VQVAGIIFRTKQMQKDSNETNRLEWVDFKSMTNEEMLSFLKSFKPEPLPICLPVGWPKRLVFTTLDQIESIEVWLDQKIIQVHIKNVGPVGIPDTEFYRDLLNIGFTPAEGG
jgi:hypothetical protein